MCRLIDLLKVLQKLDLAGSHDWLGMEGGIPRHSG